MLLSKGEDVKIVLEVDSDSMKPRLRDAETVNIRSFESLAHSDINRDLN